MKPRVVLLVEEANLEGLACRRYEQIAGVMFPMAVPGN